MPDAPDNSTNNAACRCDRYPCDHTGCDCSEQFHNPGPHCPGQTVERGEPFPPYTLTLRETRTGRYYVQRVPWVLFNGQWMQDAWHSERVSGWLDTQGQAVEFCMRHTFENPGHVGANKTPVQKAIGDHIFDPNEGELVADAIEQGAHRC